MQDNHSIFKRYEAVLSALPSCGLGNKAIAELFPHMQVKEVLGELLEGCGVVAVPAITIRNVVHLIAYNGKDNSLALSETVSLSRFDKQDERLKYAKKACDFACEAWRDRLISPIVKAVAVFNLVDPESAGVAEKVNGRRILYVALNRNFDWISYNTVRAQHSQVENALAYMTVSSIEGRELLTCGQKREVYNCEICGAPLEKYRCANCGHTFMHCSCCQNPIGDDCFRCGCEVLAGEFKFSLGPLGKTLVKFLEQSGHVFAVDPDIARQREWEFTDQAAARKMHDH